MDIVKEIDNLNIQWCNMISEPWQTDELVVQQKEQIKLYYNLKKMFLFKIYLFQNIHQWGSFSDIYTSGLNHHQKLNI